MLLYGEHKVSQVELHKSRYSDYVLHSVEYTVHSCNGNAGLSNCVAVEQDSCRSSDSIS